MERNILTDHVTAQPTKKKKLWSNFYLLSHMPTYSTHFSTTQISSYTLTLLASQQGSFMLDFFFIFSQNTNTHLTLSHPLPPVYLLPHHLHHHFSDKITGKLSRKL